MPLSCSALLCVALQPNYHVQISQKCSCQRPLSYSAWPDQDRSCPTGRAALWSPTDSQTTHKISVPHMLNCPDLCSSSLQGRQQQNIRFENTPCSSWTASQLCMYCLIHHGKYRVWVQNNLNLRILDTRCPWASANNTLGVQELQGIAQQSASSLTLIVLSLARSVWPLELSGGFSHWVVFVENFATPISPFRKAKQLCCRKERIWTVKRILGRQMLSDN